MAFFLWEQFQKRPRFSSQVSGSLVILQAIESVITFVVLLFLLVSESPWYSYYDPEGNRYPYPKDSIPITFNLIVGSVALSTTSLILTVVPTRNTSVCNIPLPCC